MLTFWIAYRNGPNNVRFLDTLQILFHPASPLSLQWKGKRKGVKPENDMLQSIFLQVPC